jgi:hypothetical protein
VKSTSSRLMLMRTRPCFMAHWTGLRARRPRQPRRTASSTPTPTSWAPPRRPTPPPSCSSLRCARLGPLACVARSVWCACGHVRCVLGVCVCVCVCVCVWQIALFTIDKVLVPGADFPLQIVKDNHAGKDMIDSTAATETRRFGVVTKPVCVCLSVCLSVCVYAERLFAGSQVTTPSFRTRPTETLTERTLPDQSRSAAAAAVEGEGEGDEGLLQPPKMRRDADGREIAMPKTRVFTRVGCMAEIYAEPTRLDDGR